MDNTNIKAPKLNISNIKSPLSGGGSGLGRVGQGGTSKLGTLARIARKNKIAINSLVKSKEDQEISDTDNKSEINSILVETNKILVEIQKQLALDFAMRASEEKEEKNKLQKEDSKKKLKAEESALEKTGKKIGKAVGKVTSKILAPVKGIFDKVLDFIITLGAGIAVNAVFEWLKDENNIKKVEGWFSWIKENWQWVAAAVGAIALLPLVGTITSVFGIIGGIVGVLTAIAGPLLALLANPIFLGALGLVLAPIAIAAGAAFTVEAIRTKMAGGDAFREAHKLNAERLKKETEGDYVVSEQGTFRDPSKSKKSGMSNVETSSKATEGMKKAYAAFKERQAKIDEIRDQMRAEMDAEKAKLKPIAAPQQGRKKQGYVDPNAKAKNRVEQNVREKYESKLANLLSTNIQARRLGGPVSPGKPYLVGEGGPEIVVPNISGTVINNIKTERMYQTISSDMGEGNISMMELQPITNQLPPPEIPVPSGPATEVPEVSSINLADPYRQLTPMLYGITV